MSKETRRAFYEHQIRYFNEIYDRDQPLVPDKGFHHVELTAHLLVLDGVVHIGNEEIEVHCPDDSNLPDEQG